ncbi:MAG: type II toxin-antitoxin system Phd/YefM family antitoxin [Candidatus Tectomicrobia bacterium]|nr:type II toxin-antitoxin system Phd/YefM family antitoxin [Candidatus Tectomicrobia bacterium]
MKTIGVRELQKQLKECVDTAQTEQVVITRHGKPAAVCIGVEGYDWEDLVWMTDQSFWKMIEERRQRAATMSQEAVEAELLSSRRRSTKGQ